MITVEVKRYIEKWPGLRLEGDIITGTVEFIGSYNLRTGQFTASNTAGTDDDISLHCSFEITIGQATGLYSKLPSLLIHEQGYGVERHINLTDGKACLCSPLEEKDFLLPEFSFEKYFEELVLPFLYAQVFFSIFNKWPWFDYAHGHSGILESYGIIENPDTKGCVAMLRNYKKEWVTIKAYLLQKAHIKGHTPCFCVKRDHMRRCHPFILKGLRKLKYDIRRMSISLEDPKLPDNLLQR